MNIKIATSNTNQTPLAWNKNFHNISKSIEEAKREKVEILCFPELCITGYSCQDLFFNDWFIEKSNTYLKKIQKLCSNITVIIGHALKYNGKLYNSVCIIKDKKIKGFFLKSNIPNDGIHYEKRWFETWKLGDIKNFIFDDEEIFIGTIQFEYNDQLTIGFEICRDSWDDERPANYIKTKKKLLILNPIASHYAFNKFNFRKNQVIESSKKFNCTYISINLLGNESGKFIFEGDTVLSQKGKLLDVSNRFSFKDYILNIYSIDFNNEKKSFIYSEQNKYEEFNAAFSLALIDYLKKTRLKGFALSLSGGLDSSVTAILVYESLKRYTKELGFNNVIKKLKISNFNLLDDDRENLKMIMNKIFITVYQKTKNSSFSTKDSADKLSHFIGSKHYEWDIDTDVESIVSKISDNTNAYFRSKV